MHFVIFSQKMQALIYPLSVCHVLVPEKGACTKVSTLCIKFERTRPRSSLCDSWLAGTWNCSWVWCLLIQWGWPTVSLKLMRGTATVALSLHHLTLCGITGQIGPTFYTGKIAVAAEASQVLYNSIVLPFIVGLWRCFEASIGGASCL